MAHRLIDALPAPLHRLALNLAHRVRVVWWRARGWLPDDCRVVALDEAGRVLLVRHSYGHGRWTLPGGGAEQGEDPVATATRELREETGCVLRDAIELGRPQATGRRHFAVVGRASGPVTIDRREIVAAAFFARDALPQGVSPSLCDRLDRLVAAYAAERVVGL